MNRWAAALVCAVLWSMPAWANQPPGGRLLLAEILVLPLMMVLTVLAGGYTILGAQGVKRKPANVVVAVLAILIAGAHEGFALVLVLIFSAVALDRGIRMIVWGLRALSPPEKRPAYLAQAVPRRLVSCGVAACVAAVALSGLGFAFVGWWPQEATVEGILKRTVAEQMARAKENRDVSGNPRYEVPKSSETGAGPTRSIGRFRSEFRLGTGGASFQMWVWPERMPFFPYNYLVTLTSFFADHTGQLRMIRVHRNGQRCPSDAPVYYRVGPKDLQATLQ